MNCRGEDTRRRIVAAYDVVPESHIRLLAGQIKDSDAGGRIKNDYYIFKAVHRETRDEETILCGMGAARDFLRLLHHEGLPIFNPLHEQGGYIGGGPQGGAEGGGRGNLVWNPVALQLYNAIMWVIIIIDARGGTLIFKIRKEVYDSRDRTPFDSQIKSINTIIRKKLQGRTLTEKIEELRGNNDIRDEICQFDMLVDRINGATDGEGNPLQSYF